jgi:hypothetical protein
MADYYPLISRAVAGLEKSTGEARRALYERARKALVDQLRGIDPPLSEADITRERLALEESIRKVETEAVRQQPARPDAAPHIPASPRAEDFQRASPPRNPPTTPAPRSERNWLDKKSAEPRPEPREGIKGFRDVVADAENLGGASAQAGRNARETYSAVPSPSPEFNRLEPRLGDDAARRAEPRARETQGPEIRPRTAPPASSRPRVTEPPRPGERRTSQVRSDLGPVIGGEDDHRLRSRSEARVLEPQPVPESLRRAAERGERDFEDEDIEDDKKPLFGWVMKTLIALGVIVLLIAGTAGLIYWKGGNLVALTKSMFSRQPAATVQNAPPRSTKIPDRVGQSDTAPPSPEAMVAQRAVLYEEGEANDQAGKTYTGTVLWRTEQVPAANGQPADRGVRGDIDIPDRGIKVVWSLRRNTDKDMPASHTISIQFVLPPNFDHGGISEIRGVLMKPSEQTRGTSLMGVSVKVTNNYFLVGLSSTDSERLRNIDMLKNRGWFDVAVVYTDGKRAILAVEKGTPGDNAFKEAFAAWGQ